jgi:GNAT superfamily N-acetyltransferase
VSESVSAEPLAAPPRYVEVPRSYLSSAGVFAVVALGFTLDLIFGGGLAHLLGWLIAAVLLAGTDALGVYAARVMRTLTVTETQLRVGEDTIDLDTIVTASVDPDPQGKVLGRRYTDNIPRGSQALDLELFSGDHVIVVTRHPSELLDLLGAAPAPGEPVRRAEPDDLLLLPEIAERADSLFRVAGLELPVLDSRADRLASAKVILVLGRPPIGYAQVDECDGLAHLQELDVLPSHMRHGYGTALVEAACDWATNQGYPAITLTTYADVAWNAPYYHRRGFVDLDVLTPGLLAAREHEKSIGLDAVGPRIAMRRDL